MTGTVRALTKMLTAPLSGRACVVYRVKEIDIPRREELAICKFLLEIDAGGARTVVVDGEAAELDLPWEPRRTHDDARVKEFHDLTTWRGTVREAIVEPGTRITVAGFAMLDVIAPERETAYRDARSRLRITGTRARPLTIRRA